MCEGIILLNNFFEILSNIDVSESESLGNLATAGDTISSIFEAAALAETSASWGGTAVTTIKDITSQEVCEEQTEADLQRYYVLIFETFL